ncbi:hemicentin-1-like [Dunckerocampus dactyliophorus]|uniref:hemicentin-1-like n=1 Tax=Dunckerocampus dactyliophorus TaxID=161453 RepID=UPI0024066B9A|nr:hemicentin-1-like [Dunckerocampus dactyliophorus]
MSERTLFAQLLVGLLLSARGACCPIELSPPSIAVKYGDPVLVNCSTADNLYNGMGWEVSLGGTGLKMTRHLTWSVDALTTWKITPHCFLNPSPGSSRKQCSKKLNVVVYTFPESIHITHYGHAVKSVSVEKGHQLKFECVIGNIAPIYNVTVRWYSGETVINEDHKAGSLKTPVDLTSEFYYWSLMEEKIRCEAHLDLRPDGPVFNVFSPELNVSVFYGPNFGCNDSMWLDEYSLQTLEDICPVTGNPTPVVRWLKDGKPMNHSVPVTRDYAGHYTIQAEGAQSVNKTLRLFVLVDDVELMCPHNLTIMEHTLFGEGIPCSVKGFPEPQVTWYKDGDEVEFPEVLTRYDAGQYVVIASNKYASANATVELDIQYKPSPIEELVDVVAELGSDAWLKCSTRGNPRPEYTWTYASAPNICEIIEDGVSLLLIRNVTLHNKGSYVCHARNEAGDTSGIATVFVKAPPLCGQTEFLCGSVCVPESAICNGVEDCRDGSDETLDLCSQSDNAPNECPIRIHPETLVLQYKSQGQNVTCTPAFTGSRNDMEVYWFDRHSNGSMTWSADTHQDWEPHPVCSAVLHGRRMCQKHLNFTLYKMPDSVVIRSEENSSLLEGTMWQLHCDIVSVAPVQSLAVRWYHGNETIEPVFRGPLRLADCPPESEPNATCDISAIRTPVNVSSSASIRLNRKLNGEDLRCEVHLELGEEGPQPPPSMMSRPVSITVYYKPIINTTKLPVVVPLFRGYPEELVCEADGHPPPEIDWIHTADARVSGGNITVSEGGLYTCKASNYLDVVLHEVEVIPKEDYLPLIAGLVAATVVIISAIFVFIYSIYYKNTKMRRYSLKNPKLSTHNGNVAHNGWDLQFPMTILSANVLRSQTASDSCPLETSLAKVVVPFGGSFSVTCKALSDQVEGMGWESPYGGTGLQKGVSNVTMHVAAWRGWSVSAICFANFRDGSQCTKQFPITAYKMPDSVTIGGLIEPMQEGTTYPLSCHVVQVAPLHEATVECFKGNRSMISYTHRTVEYKEPVNATFDWQMTVFREDDRTQVWCEARLDFGPSGPILPAVSSEPYELFVLYRPTFDESHENLSLPVGGNMTLNCTASGNPAPRYSWTLPVPLKLETENQPILTSSFQHPGTYQCTAANSQGAATKLFTVSEAPRDRTTFAALLGVIVALGVVLVIVGLLFVTPQGTFSFNKGSYSRGRPTSGPVTPALYAQPALPRQPGSESFRLIFIAGEIAQELKYIKFLLGASGDGCSLILKPPRVVVGFGEPVSVSCEAARPVRVLGWESAISAAHTQQGQSVQWKVDSLIDWIEEPICYGVFFTAPRQCEEKLNLVLYKSPDSVTITTVNHTGPMVEGKEYQLLCEVQNIAPVQYLNLRWYRGLTEVYNRSFSDLTSSSPVQVSSILVITPTKADNGAQYSCVAELELGPEGPQPPPTVTSETLTASVYFSPVFQSPGPESVDLTEGAEMTLNCTATGNPAPLYSWQASQPVQELRVEGDAVLASSSLLPGTYTCTASNTLGKKSKHFTVKAKEV